MTVFRDVYFSLLSLDGSVNLPQHSHGNVSNQCRGEQDIIYLLTLQSKWSRHHESQVFLVMMLFSNTVRVEIGVGGSPWVNVRGCENIRKMCYFACGPRFARQSRWQQCCAVIYSRHTCSISSLNTCLTYRAEVCVVIAFTAATKQSPPWHYRKKIQRDLKMK